MIEKASTVAAVGQRPRWVLTAGLAFLVVAALIIVKAGAPYLFQGATVRSELARQIRETTGLVVSASSEGRFDLLPRPRIVMKDLHFTDPSGALTIDAATLQGDVRLLPLLVGRLELAAATLIEPKLVIDLDGRPMKPDSMIGRAIHADGTPMSMSGRRLGTVTLIDGTATVKSKALGWSPVFDAIDVTVDWPDIDSPATLAGSLALEGTAADLSIWLAQPSSLMRGETSPLALRVQSTPVDLSATGDLSSAATASFHGHVALRAPSLPALIAISGTRIAPPAPFANVILNSDVTLGTDHDGRSVVDLASLHLHLDDNDYEGALAYQGGEAPTLSGTLATEQLLLAPFLDHAPTIVDAQHHWSSQPITAHEGDPIGLDLRISATHMRVAPFTIDDAALSVMTRNERTEIALVEGKAYGGEIKGRVSVGLSGSELSLRGAGSITDADAATLSWDGFGRQVATGAVSGSVNIETSGDNPAALMRHLQGWAKGRASDGELSGADIGLAIRALGARKLDAVFPALRTGRTPFQSVTFAARFADGTATIEEGSMQGTDTVVTVGGDADVGARRLDLHINAARPTSAPSDIRTPLRLDLKGTFDKVIVGLDHSSVAQTAAAPPVLAKPASGQP